jgi:gliding motility-associated-like protein
MTLLILIFLSKKRLTLLKSKLVHLFLILVAMLISSSASPQVSADFTTFSANTGCGSLVVEFQDLSTGAPDTWLWDFGNGNSSTLNNPTVIYGLPGVYDVTLVVSNSTTNDTKVSNGLVKVYENPLSELATISTTNGCMPLVVDFEDLSFTNNAIMSWQWDFGDGGSSVFQNPNYEYSTDGEFSVSLMVTDVNGCQSLSTEIDLVKVNIVPFADFFTDVTFSCNSSELVSFSNNSASASAFIWDFGDGTTSNLQNPSHSFSSGIHSVTLCAKEGSCIDTLVVTDLIEVIGSLSPDFTVDTNSGCEGFSVSFSDITANNPNVFLWDFGDGATSILQNPIHIYDTAGVYDITLTTSISSQCATSITFPDEIEVFSTPIIAFTADTTLGCSIPFSVQFSDNTINAASWSWDFGAGNFANIQTPSNIYTSSGVFDVSLLVENHDGCISSFTFPNYMTVYKPPIVNFNATPIVSCTGENIHFSDLSSIATNTWNWSFGDGSFSDIQNPIYQYSLTGTYDVSLIAGVNSCKDTLVIPDYIKIIEPSAVFEEIYNCDNPFKVEFENLSIGADTILWDFGDGTTSTLLHPIHTFLNLGIHTVSLSVKNNLTGCTHVLSKEIKLTQPIAQFDYFTSVHYPEKDSIGCVPIRIYIDNQSQDYAYFKVNWGDGHLSGVPAHPYNDTGIFDVTMIITDIHGCKDTAKHEEMFYMYDLTIDFGIANVSGCDSMLVEFDDTSNHPTASIIWEFGDGGASNINNPEYIYYSEGIYDVTLYAKSIYGCKDTIKRLEYVKFQHPIADFSSNLHGICAGDLVQFTNLSEGIGININWNFGDGSSSNILHPNHEFLANGLYDINLEITDSFGCYHNLMLTEHIQVLSPTADFSTSGLSSNCPPLISDFINLSSPDASFFEWNFGDSTISLIEDPSHLFLDSGLFDVSLIVENSFGCKDTLVQNSFIDMSGVIPMGSFILSDVLICKDDIVSFIPIVTNADNFLWDFGNGVVSSDSLATTTYSDPGIFIPILIIENSSGCQLTINSDDTIKVNEVIVDAGINVEICEGESVQLNAIGNSSIFSWSPTIGVSFPNTNNPQVNPTSSVLYYVNHTDGLCTAVDSVFVNVNNNVPNAAFTATNFCDGDLTSFVANSGLSTANNSYIWSFGQNGQLVNSVLNIGVNNITLIIENLNNLCKDTLEQNVVIFPNPVADFIYEDACLGEVVFFTDNSSINATNWAYDFGDGIGVSADQNPTYTYANPGMYNITLSLTSDMGCQDNIIKDVIIHEIPLVDFIIENHCEGDGNVFSDLSSLVNGGITSVEYDFKDGFISTDSTVTHVFNGYGLFDVELTVTSNEGCSNSKVKTTEVFAYPIVDFVASQFCEKEPTVFNNFSFVPNSNIVSYNWSFGLEGSSITKNNMYTFLSNGVYDVTLLIVSDKWCESILTKKIKIYKLPTPNFEISSDVCIGDEAELSYLSNANDANVIEWNYNFGDGTSSAEKNPAHTYNYVSSFDISLEVISLEGCKNDTIMPVIIEVHSLPIVNFQVSSLFASELSPVINFYNYSEGATFFEWNFDNGEYSFEENPSFSFDNPQIYNVVLTATNDFGCSSEMIKTVQIDPEYTLYAPNAFTPNGDGNNDVFLAKGNGVTSFEMQVFDRWGGIVFESSDIEYGWDGLDASANSAGIGTYMYHISLYDYNGKLWVYNGELNLMR